MFFDIEKYRVSIHLHDSDSLNEELYFEAPFWFDVFRIVNCLSGSFDLESIGIEVVHKVKVKSND